MLSRDDIVVYALYFSFALGLLLAQFLGGYSVQVSVQTLLTPVYGAYEYSGHLIHSGILYVQSRQELLEKVKRTGEIKHQLELTRRRLQSLAEENQRLRSQLDLPPRSGGRYVLAEVTRVDLTPFERSFVLNKGYQSGIQARDPVLQTRGESWVLRGQVLSVQPSRSQSILTSDPRFKVGVKIESIQDRQFVARGWGLRGLRIDHFPTVVPEPVGHLLHTAPASTIVPAGLIVGSVEGVDQTRSYASRVGKRLRIRPAYEQKVPRLLWVLTQND